MNGSQLRLDQVMRTSTMNSSHSVALLYLVTIDMVLNITVSVLMTNSARLHHVSGLRLYVRAWVARLGLLQHRRMRNRLYTPAG